MELVVAVAGNAIVLLAIMVQMRRDGKHHDSLDSRLTTVDNRLHVVENDVKWLKGREHG